MLPNCRLWRITNWSMSIGDSKNVVLFGLVTQIHDGKYLRAEQRYEPDDTTQPQQRKKDGGPGFL